MIPKKTNNNKSPRVRVIQKLYSNLINPDDKIIYTKSQFKKFRKDLIEETIIKHLKNDIDLDKTDKILKIIIFAAIFELLFKHNNPKKVIISEYLKTSEFFLEKTKTGYLNAILDKIGNILRKDQ